MDIDDELHSCLRVLKACVALPILLFTSSSAPPSDVTILLKYVKRWTSSTFTFFSLIFSRCLLYSVTLMDVTFLVRKDEVNEDFYFSSLLNIFGLLSRIVRKYWPATWDNSKKSDCVRGLQSSLDSIWQVNFSQYNLGYRALGPIQMSNSGERRSDGLKTKRDGTRQGCSMGVTLLVYTALLRLRRKHSSDPNMDKRSLSHSLWQKEKSRRV